MFGKTPDQKYQDYLEWFAKEVVDEANWATMRADKDCENYQTTDRDGNPIDPGKPRPLQRGEALFRMGNPKKMAKALSAKHAEQRAFVKEMSQYVGGNPANGKINPEYVKNAENLKKIQDELKRSYSVYTELSNKQIEEVVDKHQAPPPEHWVRMSPWQAFKHWLKGGKVESVADDKKTWRG